MKQLTSNLVITNSGPPLAKGVITIQDDGTIISVNNTLINNIPTANYEGILIPGFINCHCHLEISHLKGAISKGGGLASFTEQVRSIRDADEERIISEAVKADKQLFNEGVVVCADICNTEVTFELKKKSNVHYFNLLEVFGIDPERSEKRIEELKRLEDRVKKYNLDYSITPHSVYSVSLPLFRYLRELTGENRITTIHFLESPEEKQFLEDLSGPLRESYEKSGIMPDNPRIVSDHTDAILNEITPSGNLILVHNTCADKQTIREVSRRENTYWCLCAGSNRYISGSLPPVDLLLSEGCAIVTGTDSLASNDTLSIVAELMILQENFPHISLTEMISWATINGANALGVEKKYGSIEPGKSPGILLLENIDIANLKLLPGTSVKRLI